jgi:integrase
MFMSTNYLRPEHRKGSNTVSYIGFQKRGNGIYVLYTLTGERTQYRSSRKDCKHLDALPDEAVSIELDVWKSQYNTSAGASGTLYPEFYLNQKLEFFKYLQKEGANTGTIDDYNSYLGNYVFPFLHSKLCLNSPKDYKPVHVDKWEQFLNKSVDVIGTRNRIRTAFRRYLKFLKRKGLIATMPQIINDRDVRESLEKPIPCDYLPSYSEVVAYLRQIPPSRFRFLWAITFAFGVRVGEALCVEHDDVYGKSDIEFLAGSRGTIEMLADKKVAYLFLSIDSSRKKKARDAVLKLISSEEDEGKAKSGSYFACCTNKEIAKFILEVVANGEHEAPMIKNEHNFFKHLAKDDSKANFHLWRFHDARRFHITMQALDLKELPNTIDVVCELHAHHSPQTFKKYYQWGLMHKRLEKRGKSNKTIELID